MNNLSVRNHDAAVATAPAAGAASSADLPRRRRTGSELVEAFGLPALVLVVLICFAATEPRFLTVDNMRVVFATKSVLIIVALATLIPLIGGQFDLSVAATMGTASVVTAGLLSNHHWAVGAAVVAGVVSGMIVGLFNGLLVTVVGVNSLIVTLGVATILPGLVTWYTNGLTIASGIPNQLINAGTGLALGVPRSIWWVIPVLAIVWFTLVQTPWGRRLEAIGANPVAARLVGIRSNRIILTSFVASGALAGLAGVLTLARDGSANPQTAAGGLLLPALAAVFLGATAFRPGHYNIPGTLVAVLFVAFSVSGLTLAGAAPWVEQVFDGSALVVAVTLSTMAANGRPRVMRRPASNAESEPPAKSAGSVKEESA